MLQKGLYQLISGASTYHADVVNLNNRVIAAGGSMTTTVLQALNDFVVWCHTNGLRSGTDPVIRWLWIPLTQTFSGSLEKLWYPSGSASALVNNGFVSGNYAQDTGLTGTGTAYLQTGFIPSTHLAANQNAHFALYSRTSAVQSDAHGTLISGNRLLIQPNWGGSTDGDYLNKRTSFTSYNGGLLLLNSLDASSLRIWHRGSQKTLSTTAASNSNSTVNLQMFLFATNSSTGAANYSTRSISGASMGTAIPEALIPDFSSRWQTLLASVSATRPV